MISSRRLLDLWHRMTPTTPARHRIRPGTPRDLPALLRIESLAFEPARRSSRATLKRALGSAFQRVLVAEVSGQVAGYVVVWRYRRTWRIYNLASDPGLRRQGIGGALMTAAVTAARGAGAHRVVLESRDEPGLLGFYRQRGFRLARRLAGYYGEGEDAVRMEMSLPGAG